MAHRIGVSQSAYTRFENGSTKLDYFWLEKICIALNINIEALIYYHLRLNPTSYYHHFNMRFLKSVKEASKWQEKCHQLEKLIDTLEDQLNDKKEIIRLLKSKQL